VKRPLFRIHAPFTTPGDIAPLKRAGADELFCGFVTGELTKRWPVAFNILNRRGEHQSFEDEALFKEALREAQVLGLPVYVTLNGLYTPEQYPFLLELIRRIEGFDGVQGMIVADVALLLTLQKEGFAKEIHVSTGGTCFNSGAADFYHSLGASRVILPRHLTAGEIRDIIAGKRSSVDIELFAVREPCGGFIDGYCAFFHCFERPPVTGEEISEKTLLFPSFNTEQPSCGCSFYFLDHLAKGNYETFGAVSRKPEDVGISYQPERDRFAGLSGCRLCDLYDLKDLPVRSLKIVGRGADLGETVPAVKLLAEARALLEERGISANAYTTKCKELFSRYILKGKRRCSSFDCYFSSHWVKQG
jgi:putative protease